MDNVAFIQPTPFKSVILDLKSAQRLHELQIENFTGRLILQMREGHIIDFKEEAVGRPE